MDDIANFLSGLPLFQQFSAESLTELTAQSHVQEFAPQEKIIRFGQSGKFLGIMLEGTAEAVVIDRAGEKHRLGLLHPGDILGEMSLLTGEPTSADVIAQGMCRIILIPQEIFTAKLAVNPHAVMVMSKTIADRLRRRQNDEDEQARVADAWQNVEDPYGLSLTSVLPKKILVINCGSSSLKYSYFDTAEPDNNRSGVVERIGLKDSRLITYSPPGRISHDLGEVDHEGAFDSVIATLTDEETGVIDDLDEMSAVGHRVVHGGDKYSHAVVIEDHVLQDVADHSALAPLHNPHNLKAIEQSRKYMPKVPQVAVFDTGFHQRMPRHAQIYGIPFRFYSEDHIKRYGFHGISHHYVTLQTATHLRRGVQELKIISCHLGNGASICAIDHGRSVDTSTGMTPLEGLVMGTRSGDLDPGIILHLQRERGLSVEEIDDLLNRRSGLEGLSGVSSDFRQLEEAANQGDERALLTIHVFCYRIRKYIGAYMAALGGLDALAFTGGIGENSAWVRGLACQGLDHLGLNINSLLNKTAAPEPGKVLEISDEDSRAKILIIPADEARMIARETLRTLGHQTLHEVLRQKRDHKIPIEVSAHHVHLSQKEIATLFGPEGKLKIRTHLSQPGQYACEETVDLIGPKGKVERVRILGPPRKESQVEISMTEEYKLGIKAPIRASGNLKGSPGVTLEGPQGTCQIAQGVICSLRHIHMSPMNALTFGLKDRDIVSVKVEGERTTVFGDVLVRVHPDFHLSMHIDTDEANAAAITTGMEGMLMGVQSRG